MHSRLIGPTGAATANPVLNAFQNSQASMGSLLRVCRMQTERHHRNSGMHARCEQSKRLPRAWLETRCPRRTCSILELNARRKLKQRLVQLAVCFIAQKAYRVFVLGRFHRNLKRSVVRLEVQRDLAAVDLQPEW